jgi:transcriptional regulator with XRE-family HTH domain
MNDLGFRIRTARKARRLTQKELAARLGVDVRTVIRWEQNHNEPGRAERKRIALTLGVKRGYLDAPPPVNCPGCGRPLELVADNG